MDKKLPPGKSVPTSPYRHSSPLLSQIQQSYPRQRKPSQATKSSQIPKVGSSLRLRPEFQPDSSPSSPTPVVIRFKSVGSAPIMKQNFFKITASHKFQAVVQFLRKELRWKAEDPLVCAQARGKPEGGTLEVLIGMDPLAVYLYQLVVCACP